MHNDIRKISILDNDYPAKLKEIKSPPKILYVKGSLPDPSKKTVAIVGARNASEYGLTLGRTIAKILSQNNVQIISGLALGIDTSAHIGALDVDKPNFAILGSGVDVCFPAYNKNVYERICDARGGIISEFELGEKPMPYNFPMRNRIIAGLSDVVIVVEARSRSGSLITADYALEQGKTIFACPGRVGDSLSQGTNNLIKQGAYILTSANDILEHLGIIVDGMLPKTEFDPSKLDYYEKLIFDTLGDDTKHIDEIVMDTKLPVDKCINVLMSLELSGFVESSSLNFYKRVSS